MKRIATVLTLGLASGCGDKDTQPLTDDTGDVLITVETGLWIDTSEPSETGDTDTDTAIEPDTATDTGGDTGSPFEGPEYASLALYPDGMVVQPGAIFGLRLVGSTEETEDVAVEHIVFASSDEAVATIDEDGQVTALSVGEISLSATVGEVSAEVSLTVEDSGTIRVQIIRADTGMPMTEAKVKVEEGDVARTDADGWATLEVETGEPISVHGYLSGYMAVTVFQTVSRELVIPLQDFDLFDDQTTQISGEVSFDSVDSGSGADMVIGLALPALPLGPLMLDPDELMSADRELSIFGIDVSLPENLYLKSHAESYAVPARPGEAAVWTIAGPMPISEITSSLDGASDAFELIDSHIADMSWGWADAGTLALGDTVSSDLAPAIAMTGSATIQTGDLPLGFSGDEVALVMVGERLEDVGAVALGLGTGLGEVELSVADTTLGGEPIAMAIAQVGGLGSGGGVSAVLADMEDRTATLPEFQSVPEMVSFNGVTHDFELSTDTRADIVRVLIRGNDRTARMVFMDGGAQGGHLPDPNIFMGYGETEWEVLGFETTADTFEGYVRAGALSAEQIAPTATTSARVTRSIVSSSSGK
jgi:hypothetical protein